MIRLVACLSQQHSPGLLLLAVIVCLLGSAAAAQLFLRTRTATGAVRAGWLCLTAVSSGAMVWSTHFVAMMAFHAHAPVVLDPGLTLLSLLIAIGAAVPGLLLALRTGAWSQLLGGGLVGASVATMHYTGMAAYRIDGFVFWDAGYVLASVVMACGLGAAAFRMLGASSGRAAMVQGGLLLGAAVALLHFTGMSAMTIIPAPLQADGLSKATMTVMALGTVFAGLLVIGCAAVSALIDGHTREDAFRRLRRLALLDSLTELPNRASFNDDLTRRLEAEPNGAFALVMIDLCGFKAVNDRHGHQAGDQLLVAISARLGGAIRPGETAYRLGGDEFAVVIPGDRRDVQARTKALADVFEAEFRFERFTTHCGASIGVALHPENAGAADDLVACADLAMYRAKRAGSPSPLFYDSAMDQTARRKRQLAAALKTAVGGDEFALVYQVQASTRSGEVSGYEALARWTSVTYGAISPDVFIPIAEEAGEIERLGMWVLQRACREAATWPAPYPVAVNLSPLQLRDPKLLDRVRSTLETCGLAPGRLELELTESSIIHDRDRALEQLMGLKRMGVTLALDDFGTGFSSLDVLRSFPFDRLKLDRSLITDIQTSPQSVAILESVASLGRTLGVPVLAEGVETAEQLKIVARSGCSDVQGYLLGRPARALIDAAELRRIMQPALRHPGMELAA